MQTFAYVILFLFLICFPKGGFKIDALPFTWGYLLLFFLGSYNFFQNVLRRPIPKIFLGLFFVLVPFQTLILLKINFIGFENFGVVVSLITSFIGLPWLFIFGFSYQLNEIKWELFMKLLKNSLIFISFFGVFLFFYKWITGEFLEIPFLTINGQDSGLIGEKNLDRGSIFKLISTYNNGNIYGICVLMLLPLYSLLTKRFYQDFIVKLSLLLTLSRTVWIGLIMYEILQLIFFRKKKIFVSLIIIAFFLFTICVLFQFNRDFLLDSEWGGRRGQFNVFEAEFFSFKPLEYIAEMTYVGMIREFGYLGFLLFLLPMLYPFIFLKNDQLSRALGSGLFLYLFVSIADGAIEMIPVMAIYWALSFFLLARNQTSYLKFFVNEELMY